MLWSNKLSRVHQKRTIRPLYAWHQATPYACFLDDAAVGTTVVYPGMVATKTTGEMMKVAAAADVPFGLFNNFINGEMDELHDDTAISVWRGGPDATFEVLAGPTSSETPLDSAVTWTSHNATAGGVPLYKEANGRLTTTVSGPITARLVEAVSNAKIIITLDLRTS